MSSHEDFEHSSVGHPADNPHEHTSHSAAPSPEQRRTRQQGPPLSGLQRAVNVARVALPFVQKLLPMLDHGIISAVSSVLAPPSHPSAPLPPPVNIAPLQNSVADLRVRHQELRNQVAEQTTAIRKVEDRLDLVREATDRNTLEQQELIEDLKSVSRKINLFAWAVVALLVASVGLNVFLVLSLRLFGR